MGFKLRHYWTLASKVDDARRGLRDQTMVTDIVTYPARERSYEERERDIADMGGVIIRRPAATRYATKTVTDYPNEPRLSTRHHEIIERMKGIEKEKARYGHSEREEAGNAPEPLRSGMGR